MRVNVCMFVGARVPTYLNLDNNLSVGVFTISLASAPENSLFIANGSALVITLLSE